MRTLHHDLALALQQLPVVSQYLVHILTGLVHIVSHTVDQLLIL